MDSSGPGVQVVLDPGGRGAELGCAGEAPVLCRDAGSGPPHGQISEQMFVGGVHQVHRPRGRRGWRVLGGLFADVDDQGADQVGSGAQVGAVLLMGGQDVGDGGQPGQRSALCAAPGAWVQAPVQDRGRVGGGVQLAAEHCRGQGGHGVVAVGGQEGQVGPQSGVCGGVGQAWVQVLGHPIESVQHVSAEDGLGDDPETVAVSGDGIAQ